MSNLLLSCKHKHCFLKHILVPNRFSFRIHLFTNVKEGYLEKLLSLYPGKSTLSLENNLAKNQSYLLCLALQLREYKKDLEYRLHHRWSKFDRSVFLILKPISYYFWRLYGLVFLSRNYWSSLDHDLMASI